MNRPGPYHSKLRPYAERILAWRRDGQTWKQIVEHLKDLGCQTDQPAVLRFTRKYEVKPYAVGQKPAPQTKGGQKFLAKILRRTENVS